MSHASVEYAPRKPEETVLYGVVAEHLATFLARRQERDRPVPRFVEQEFRRYLTCGILEHGFLRIHCDRCGHDEVLPFSCKKRGWCPSCGGRKMAETAAHLVDRVMPFVPVRQWVLSLPFKLRYRMAYDSKLMAEILNIFIRVVSTELQRRAHERFGIRQSQSGSVTFVQRFGSALNLNVHFHSVFIDGIYAADAKGRPEFWELPAPSDMEVLRAVTRIAEKVEDLIRRRGLEEESDPLSEHDPGLAALYAAAVRGRVSDGANVGNRLALRGDRIDGDSLDAVSSSRCAGVLGFNLHGNVEISAFDRSRLERLLRYAARPSLATERLSQLADGRLQYNLKRPWSNGATDIIFEPQDFLAKLAALVPAPRVHLTRFHGVLAPASKWRPLVIPSPPEPSPDSHLLPLASPATLAEGTAEPTLPLPAVPSRKPNYTWAQLMMRVFSVDVLACGLCGGRLRIVSPIHPPDTTRKILDCLGLPSRAPPIAPAEPADDRVYF